MTTYSQGTELVAKQSVRFVNPKTNRKCTIIEGSRYWVASTQLFQQSNNAVEIAKQGAPMGSGYLMTPQDAAEIFTDVL
jgi:hypothetical protein